MVKLNTLCTFLEDNRELIESIKVTQFNQGAFNSYEGSQYRINVKVNTAPGYRNKLIKVITNSTYLEDLEDRDDFQNWLASYLD